MVIRNSFHSLYQGVELLIIDEYKYVGSIVHMRTMHYILFGTLAPWRQPILGT